MQLAFSTNAFKRCSLEQAVETIGAIGYAGVEIMADVPHAYPPHMPGERVAALHELLTKSRLAVSNVNAFTLFAVGDTYHPTWLENDPAQRRIRIDHTRNCIPLAAAIGAKTISLQPGGPLEGPRADALKLYADGLRELLPAAQKANITLMVEPEPGLLIEHSYECIEFLNQVSHPNLKMNCDLGHFYCVNEDPAAVLRQCAPYIAHVHLEDIRENRVHQHLQPGLGAMDFPAIFAALNDIHYAGWVTVELYPYESTAEQVAQAAFSYLQPFMK